jgi:hypothetical protein
LLFIRYIFFYRSTIASLRHGDSLYLALRKRFSKKHNLATFNTDDIFMFYKSVVPLMLRSMQSVFNDYDIPVTVIEDYIEIISNSTSVINIQEGGVFNNLGNILTGKGNIARATVSNPSISSRQA